MEDVGSPLPAGKYPLLDRLAATGIRGLYELSSTDYGFTARRRGYLNHCDLCTDIRHFLQQTDGPGFAELAPRGFSDALSSMIGANLP